MIEAKRIIELLSESMFYPCSEDDGTPIKRCQHMFPLYVYVDYYFEKENIGKTLKYHDLVEEKELSPEELFNKSWEELCKEYEYFIKKLPFKFHNPYIVVCDFRHQETNKHILTVNIKFEAVAMYKELYIKNNTKPKGLAHLRCGLGFGGNYVSYIDELCRALLSNPAGLPEYILVDSLCVPGKGDYLPILKYYKPIKMWEYFRPAYRERGFDILYRKKYSLLELLKLVNVKGRDNGEIFIDPTRRNNIIDIIDFLNEYPEIELLRKDEYLNFLVKRYLRVRKIKLLHKDDYLLIYTTGIRPKGDIVLISCHIDHVFDEHQLFLKQNGEEILGTLDNSACIASLLYSLQEYNFPQNVIISFTGGEEKGFIGAEKTRDWLEDEHEDWYDRLGMVITLDVTADNVDKDISIENLNIEKENFEQTQIRFNSIEDLKRRIEEIFKETGINLGFIIEAEPDESHFYREWDLNTISLCLPCECPDGDLHSPKGCKTTIKKMELFAKAIYLLVENFTGDH